MFFSNLWDLGIGICAILMAITFHEYAHGKVATLLGDSTPADQGRLTLNPFAHLDLIGTLLLVVAGFGWAKPVPVNPFNFRGDRQRGMMLVGIAGPATNLVLAYLAGLGFNLTVGSFFYLSRFFYYLLLFNVVLAVFNLLPIPPLDGSRVLAWFFPRSTYFLSQLEVYGSLFLLLLVFTGLVGRIIGPVVNAVFTFIQVASSISLFG